MENFPDHYELFQVLPNAEPEVIEAAYYRLVRKYHPDVNQEPQAAAYMSMINQAYAILSDPVLRVEYDRLYFGGGGEKDEDVSESRMASELWPANSPQPGPSHRIFSSIGRLIWMGFAILFILSISGNIVGIFGESVEHRIGDANQAASEERTGRSPVSGTMSIFETKIGDCLQEPRTGVGNEEVQGLRVVPCSGNWDLKVIGSFAVSGSGSFPGYAYFNGQVESRCSRLATVFMVPSSESWAYGDRTVNCLQKR